MSHPDPLFDPENSYEDDEMNPNYDDHDDFHYGETERQIFGIGFAAPDFS